MMVVTPFCACLVGLQMAQMASVPKLQLVPLHHFHTHYLVSERVD